MGLQQIVYISSTTQDYSEKQLSNMLLGFRANNQHNQVTGILLYKNRRFMQLLEGEKQTVDRLFEKIRNDNRHQTALEIYNMPALSRTFAEWAMSFYNLNNPEVSQVKGYSDYLDADLDHEVFKAKGEAMKFLRIFKLSTVST